MSGVTAALACLVALGGPVAAMLHWARRGGSDGVEAVAAALGGLGVAVIGIWWSASWLGLGPPGLMLGPLALGVAIVLVGETTDGASRGTPRRVKAGLAVLVLVFVVATLVPLLPYGAERADGVHRMSMTDWEKHLLFTTEMAADDAFPPANPFLRASGPTPYYAGFHLLAAVVARSLGGPDASLVALIVLLVVTAAGAPLVAFLLARAITGSAFGGLVGASLATLLGGFDMVVLGLATLRDAWRAWPLPGGFAGLRALVPSVNPDFWIHHNERQFYPPYRATIWAPQHVLAALLALLAIHWLYTRQPRRRDGALVCGLLLAGCLALSAYVAMVAGIWLAVVLLADSLAGGTMPWRSRLWPGWLRAGTVALAAGLPLLLQFSTASGADLVVHVSAAGSPVNGAIATTVLGDGWWTRLLDSPLILVIELGVVGLLGGLALWRRRRGATGHGAAAVAAATAVVLILVVVVRPPVGGPNNLYARGPLVVWFLLAALAAEALLETRRGLLRRTALFLCALYVPYAMVGATVEGWVFWPTPRADHEAARWIANNTPDDAIVALPPDRGPRYLAYWSRRRILVGDDRLARLFGAGRRQVLATRRRLSRTLRSATRAEAAAGLRDLGASWLVYTPDQVGFAADAAGACLPDRFHAGRWIVAEVRPAPCS